MTNISINFDTGDDGRLRLIAAGEIDLATRDQLTATIDSAVSGGHLRELVIDLDRVTFLDSAGIQVQRPGDRPLSARPRKVVAGRTPAADGGACQDF